MKIVQIIQFVFLLAFILVFFLFVGRIDWLRYFHLLFQVKINFIFLIMLSSVISYFLIGLSFVLAVRFFFHGISRFRSFYIGLLSSAISNNFSLGGLSGASMRIYLLKKQKMPLGKISSALILHAYATGVVSIYIFMPLSLFYILQSKLFNQKQSSELFLAGLLMSLLLFFLTLFFVKHSFRKSLFARFSSFGKILKFKNPDKFLLKIDYSLGQVGNSLKTNKKKVLLLFICLLLDWIMMALTLCLAYFATGISISVAPIFMGFSLSVLAGSILFFTGGWGVQDLSMIGILSLFGISLEHSLVAVSLFRLFYYIIPLIVSLLSALFIYKHNLKALLRQIFNPIKEGV